MKPLKNKPRVGPEAKLQDQIIAKLRNLEWVVKETHGNIYQSGFPDLYCAHHKYGTRWIECKIEEHYRFTPAQLDFFPKLDAAGVGIWVVTHVDQVPDLLFRAPNWVFYLDIWRKR